VKTTRLTIHVDAEDHFLTGECDKYMQLQWTSNVARTQKPDLPRKFGLFGTWRGASHWKHHFGCELPDTGGHSMQVEFVVSATNPLSRYVQPSIIWTDDSSVVRYGDVALLSRWQDIYRDYELTVMLNPREPECYAQFIVTLEPPTLKELELFQLRAKFEECSYA
jgi:hypothetical protein